MDYMNVLARLGDKIERQGCELGVAFPRYAEFWCRFVVPNRDPGDSSKLRPGLPEFFEDLCNNHYSVFYHLTVAYRQIPEIENGIVDVADPLYHLASAVDLVERTFVIAYQEHKRLNNETLDIGLSEDDFRQRAEKYWGKKYSKALRKFKLDYKPVNIPLHSVGSVFDQVVRGEKQGFRDIKELIRRYRNIFTHKAPPLKFGWDNQTNIPKLEHLKKYETARWSSIRPEADKEEFEPAEDLIRRFADDLVEKANIIWEELLSVVDEIVQSDVYRQEVVSLRVDQEMPVPMNVEDFVTWQHPGESPGSGEIYDFARAGTASGIILDEPSHPNVEQNSRNITTSSDKEHPPTGDKPPHPSAYHDWNIQSDSDPADEDEQLDEGRRDL